MQPLYPINIFSVDEVSNIPNNMEQGSLTCISITLEPGNANIMAALQAAVAEDFSIRAWFSTIPNGPSIFTTPLNQAHFSLLRIPFNIVLYDASTQPPVLDNTNTQYQVLFPVEPGIYYLNLLNLINMRNIFTFSMNVVNNSGN